MWLSQGPSWLLKGRRENRYLDRFTEEDHAGICEVWLAADECASLTNEVQQLQLRWRELACFCQHAPLLQVESSPAEQLFWALYLLAESGEDEHWLLSRSKGKPGGLSASVHSGTGLSAACFQGLMAQAVHLRFQGDGAARRSWLHERAKEAELVEEFESLIRTWSLHDAAVGRAAHNVKLRADEAQQQRALAAEKEAAKQRQCDARASARLRVEAAAAAVGRSHIIKLNASKWPPPDIMARGSDGECLHVIEDVRYECTRRGPVQLDDGRWVYRLSREQFEALPEDERVLCQRDRCPHKKERPQCERHCKCKGFEKLMSAARYSKVGGLIMKPHLVEVRTKCQFYERRTVTAWRDLSDPILWYWQMTGDTWYAEPEGQADALSVSDRSVKHYEAQVQAWHALREGGNASSSKAAGKRKLQPKS